MLRLLLALAATVVLGLASRLYPAGWFLYDRVLGEVLYDHFSPYGALYPELSALAVTTLRRAGMHDRHHGLAASGASSRPAVARRSDVGASAGRPRTSGPRSIRAVRVVEVR